MAYAAMKPTKPGLEEPEEQIHKIRITLSSKNVKNLEKGLSSFSLSFFFSSLFFILLYIEIPFFVLQRVSIFHWIKPIWQRFNSDKYMYIYVCFDFVYLL